MTEFLLFEALRDLAELEEILENVRARHKPAPLIPPEVQAQMDAFKAFETG